MELQLKQEIVEVLNLIQKARKYTSPFNAAELFKIAEELISKQAWLIGFLLDNETKYREKILEFRQQTKTKADAEIQAKTTQEYKDYKFIQYSYDLINSQIMLVKKFSTMLSEEQKLHI